MVQNGLRNSVKVAAECINAAGYRASFYKTCLQQRFPAFLTGQAAFCQQVFIPVVPYVGIIIFNRVIAPDQQALFGLTGIVNGVYGGLQYGVITFEGVIVSP